MSTPFEYKVCQQAEGYLAVDLIGDAGTNEIVFMYQDVCDVAQSNEFDKILVNAKKLNLDFSMTEFVPLMKQLSPLLSQFKIARLCNVFEFRQDLIENVSLKENIALKNFKEESEAVIWLTHA